jgi:hypothetical protein
MNVWPCLICGYPQVQPWIVGQHRTLENLDSNAKQAAANLLAVACYVVDREQIQI